MSAICHAIESAFVRMLCQLAGSTEGVANSFALATHAKAVDVVPGGLLVYMDDAPNFTVNFYSGQSEEKVELPAIIVTCDNGQRIEEAANVQTCNVELSLEVQCDSKQGVNSVEWLDQASRWLHDLLSGSYGLARDIETADPNLVVSYVSTAECGRSAEGRRRINRWAFQIVASI